MENKQEVNLSSRLDECRRELRSCLRRERDLKAARDRAEGELGKMQEIIAHLKSELFLSRQGFESIDSMRAEALSDAETAYQRGLSDGLERAVCVVENFPAARLHSKFELKDSIRAVKGGTDGK